jgi:hypothetical protein
MFEAMRPSRLVSDPCAVSLLVSKMRGGSKSKRRGGRAEREELRSWGYKTKEIGNSQVKGNEALTTETETETETGICNIFQTYLDNKIIAFLSNPQMVRMG